MNEICEVDNVFLDGALEHIDGGMGFLVLQLNLAGIKTLGSCSGHGRNFPNVHCAPDTEEKLKAFGCKIYITTENKTVEAFFPHRCHGGKIYPVDLKKWCYICQRYKFPRNKDNNLDYPSIDICKEHKMEALHSMVIDYWRDKRGGPASELP